MHIVYLTNRPLSKRDAERFGVRFMLAKGHSVTVIDLNDVIFPKLAGEEEPYYDDFEADLHVIRNWREFWALKELIGGGDLAISLVRSSGLCMRSLPVFRMLSKVRVPYLVIAPLVGPGLLQPEAQRSLFNRAWAALVKFQPNDIAASVLSRIPLKFLRLPCARYVVYNGTVSMFPNVLVDPNTIPINVHAHDFDLFTETLNKKPSQKNQAVFLDQNIPHHPDAVALGFSYIHLDDYYTRLSAAFDKIESELSIKVVIAAHPRADRSRMEKDLDGRNIVFGQTALAVAESRLVLSHWSKATNFAILFNKPIYFMVTRDIYEWTDWMPYYIDALCRELGKELHFYDDPQDLRLDDAFQFSEDVYRRYVAQFIKAPGSPNRPYWEIISDRLEQDFPIN